MQRKNQKTIPAIDPNSEPATVKQEKKGKRKSDELSASENSGSSSSAPLFSVQQAELEKRKRLAHRAKLARESRRKKKEALDNFSKISYSFVEIVLTSCLLNKPAEDLNAVALLRTQDPTKFDSLFNEIMNRLNTSVVDRTKLLKDIKNKETIETQEQKEQGQPLEEEPIAERVKRRKTSNAAVEQAEEATEYTESASNSTSQAVPAFAPPFFDPNLVFPTMPQSHASASSSMFSSEPDFLASSSSSSASSPPSSTASALKMFSHGGAMIMQQQERPPSPSTVFSSLLVESSNSGLPQLGYFSFLSPLNPATSALEEVDVEMHQASFGKKAS